MDDAELLDRYVSERSDTAFAELVRRHVDLVYSAAARQMRGDPHGAQEVTQMVFLSLARKARELARHPALSAWLYRATRYASLEVGRKEARRKRHERAAALEALNNGSAKVPGATTDTDGGSLVRADWTRLGPVLDEALNALGERDRDAIVLRFFTNRSFGEIGHRLGLSENAARMRVGRALDKLRDRLARRGIASTSAALAACLAADAVSAAPAAALSAATSMGAAAALAGSAAGGGTSAIILFMTANKLSLSLLTAVAAARATGVVLQSQANARAAAQLAAFQSRSSDLAALGREHRSLTQDLAAAHDLEAAVATDAKYRALTAELADLRRQVAPLVQPPAKGAASEIYDLSQLDQQPRVLSQVAPTYPSTLYAQGIGGNATVDLIVDSAGHVRNAYAIAASHPEFGGAAVAAVSQWDFAPGRRQGRDINTHLQVPVVFTPPDATAPAPITPSAVGNGPAVILNQVSVPATPQNWFPNGSHG